MRYYSYKLYCPTTCESSHCYSTETPANEYTPKEYSNHHISSSEKTKLEVSFFDRVGDAFVRTCTTLRKEDNSCAQGTTLDPASPAYQNLINGMDYTGEVTIYGKNYFPKYVPIKNNNGYVIGAISVGKRIS